MTQQRINMIQALFKVTKCRMVHRSMNIIKAHLFYSEQHGALTYQHILYSDNTLTCEH